MNDKKAAVYCKNCEHYSLFFYRCYAEVRKNPYTGRYSGTSRWCEENYSGNCPNYKRKWWKFWVK
jgi:hypothetical protein